MIHNANVTEGAGLYQHKHNGSLPEVQRSGPAGRVCKRAVLIPLLLLLPEFLCKNPYEDQHYTGKDRKNVCEAKELNRPAAREPNIDSDP